MEGTDALPLEENLLLGFLLQSDVYGRLKSYLLQAPHGNLHGGGGGGGGGGGYLKRTSYMKIGYN